MITQKIIARTDSLKLDKIISRYGEDSMRQVVFIIVRPEPDSEELIPITIPEDAVGSFRILKPSGNFVIVPMNKSVLASGETAFDVVLPASANTAKGSGYYDIRITSNTDKYYFTAQGDFIIDDNIISDEVLEDVSEVNGLVFPDDFLTVEDNVAIIDDDTISTDSTWSSNKISEEIEAHAGGDVSKTVSGNPVIFTDGASAPLVKCVTEIQGYQEGSGTPSPDNIRPIVAYTEGEIEVWGKNLAPSSPISRGQYVDGAFQNNDNRICSYYINILPNITYTASIDRSNTENLAFINYAYFDKNKTYLGDRATNGESAFSGDKVHTFSVSNAQAAYIRLTIRAYSSSDLNISDKTLDNAQLMFEKGSTATTYEPYTSTTHTTAYPSAIYRGSEDVVNGEVTTEWGVIASYAGEALPGEWISDRDEYAPGTTPTTGAQVAYELATPTTSSATPTNLPIKSISGYNHIESSTGDMEVEYITQRFQPLIDSIKQL